MVLTTRPPLEAHGSRQGRDPFHIDLMDDFDELEKLGQWKACCLPDVRRLLEKEAASLQDLKNLQDLEDDDSKFGQF